MRGYRCFLLVWLVLWVPLVCGQDIEFPPLTGRVVDRADMIDAATEQRIVTLLAGHEQATSNQVVVVTLKDLQGIPIEDFGYQLGRHWGIGQKGEDNGAILLVSEADRKVRIEVGYGLEGELTDAISSSIINSVILPEFRRGQFNEGIAKGVEAMVQAIGGEYQPPAQAKPKPTDLRTKAFILFLVFGGWLLLASVASVGGGPRAGRNLLLLGALGALGGGRGGGFGGGGFGGGGGGFGGGGASGGW